MCCICPAPFTVYAARMHHKWHYSLKWNPSHLGSTFDPQQRIIWDEIVFEKTNLIPRKISLTGNRTPHLRTQRLSANWHVRLSPLSYDEPQSYIVFDRFFFTGGFSAWMIWLGTCNVITIHFAALVVYLLVYFLMLGEPLFGIQGLFRRFTFSRVGISIFLCEICQSNERSILLTYTS